MDAQRLLGSLLMSGMRAPARRVDRAAIGLGVLGIAIAAFEHFSQQQAQRQGGPSLPGAPPPGGGPPPLPGAGPPSAVPPPLPQVEQATLQERALLLVRAMVAAAWADGQLDSEERDRILQRLAAAGITGEGGEFLASALNAPPALETLLAQVGDPQSAEEFYVASLLAITVDSEPEREYLRRLAARLGLRPEQTARLHALVGAPPLVATPTQGERP